MMKQWLRVGAGCVLASLLAGCETGLNENFANGFLASTNSIRITPASVVLAASTLGSATFAASGGDSNYTWTVSSTNLGNVVGAGATALYTNALIAGVNTIVVTDGQTNTASATVTQQ